MSSLYERIGPETVARVLTEFYIRAFADPMIGHFFFGHDRESITRLQIAFASAMLGGPRNYRGRPLETVHHALPIRPPHFARRQVIMREVLDEMGVPPDLGGQWLALEERLKPLIIGLNAGCNN